MGVREDLAQTEEQTQLQEEVEQILPENGTILFTDHVLMIIPMQHVPGTLTLTRTSLSFIVDTEYITSMKQKITDLDAKIASGSFKGENKWRTLGLPENCAWPIEELESEEFRLFEVWWNCGIIKIVFGFWQSNYSSQTRHPLSLRCRQLQFGILFTHIFVR